MPRRLTNAQLLEKYKNKSLRMLTPNERIEFMSHAPGVSPIKAPFPMCEGWMNKTALKHIYGTEEQRAQKPTCKFKARWKYAPIKNPKDETGYPAHVSEGGNFCWTHLWARGIYGSMLDDKRYYDWLRRVGFSSKAEPVTVPSSP